MDMQQVGRLLLILGIGIAVVGGLFVLLGGQEWVRRLFEAGTLRAEGGGVTCIVPILGSIILSIFGTIVLNIIIRLINK